MDRQIEVKTKTLDYKEYGIGKKLVMAVLHQLFFILLITGLFYFGTIRHLHYPVNIWQQSMNNEYSMRNEEIFLDKITSSPMENAWKDFRQSNNMEMICVAAISIVALVASLLILANLTLMSGRESNQDTKIHLRRADKIPSDVMFILFLVMLLLIVQFIYFLRDLQFDLGGLLVTAGTVAYLADIPFIFFYLSFVRRIKADILWKGSLIYKLDYEIKKISAERHWVARYMLHHIIRLVVGLICTTLVFVKEWYGLSAIVVVIILWDIYAQMKHATDQHKIQEAIEQIALGELDTLLDLDDFQGQEQDLAAAVNSIRNGLQTAVDESIKNERMKADLITNVSHDIKTPLTSIINYAQILARENIENESAKKYINVINDKAQRLKQLTEDLVEASRISSGNIKIELNRIDLVELIYQTGGEFNERFEARNLTIVTKLPQTSAFILADGRQLYRSIENLYINAAKYAMENTRVYVSLYREDESIVFEMKNVSAKPVENEKGGARDLTERFVRGEVSRTTEGSGLGLSIAKNLVQLMGGEFEVAVDGDLFIVTMRFTLDL